MKINIKYNQVDKNNPYRCYIHAKMLDSDAKITRFEIMRLIKKLPIKNTLYQLFNIDLFLSNNGDVEHETQKELVKILFNNEPQIIEGLNNWLNTNSCIAFGRQHIYYFMSLVLRYGENNDKIVLLKDIGKILLMMSDILSKKSSYYKSKPNEKNLEMKAEIVWEKANLFFYKDNEFGSELNRINEVFCKTPSGSIFMNTFYQATGLYFHDFLIAQFVIYSNWSNNDKFNSYSLKIDNYRSVFNPEIIKSVKTILDILSSDVTSLKELCIKRIKEFGNEEHNFEFLSEKPLLIVGDEEYICLSRPFFISRTTKEVLITLKDILKEKNLRELDSNSNKAYDEYIDNLIRDSYSLNPVSTEQATTGDDRNSSAYNKNNLKREEISDGLIKSSDTLIFIEVKAKTINESTRLSNKHKDIENKFKNFLFPDKKYVNRGISQLEDKIEKFKSGELSTKKLNKDDINYYQPIMVTCIHHLHQFDHLTDFYDSILKRDNILQKPYIKPLIIMTDSEFEFAMNLVEKGHSFLELLEQRMLPENKTYTFLNFLLSKYTDERSERTNEKIKLLMDNYMKVLLPQDNINSEKLEKESKK